ncbi:MAG: YtxH domain-containing protein [Anaerolineae bacterium]|nr:YtxH domain-containing protein [Anaerolineae bacterium]
MARDSGGGETFSFITGLIMGFIVSAPVAAWLSPRSGQETRETIRQQGVVIRRRAADVILKPVAQVQDAVVGRRTESVAESLDEGRAIAARKRLGADSEG